MSKNIYPYMISCKVWQRDVGECAAAYKNSCFSFLLLSRVDNAAAGATLSGE